MNNYNEFLNLINNNFFLNNKQINKINSYIKRKTNTYYNLNKISYLKKKDILKIINYYKLPSFIKDNNLNINNIKDTKPCYGIIIQKANLKSFPTYKPGYKYSHNFISFQEACLSVNTPVTIIHESKDHKWNLVISPFYIGWVEKKNISLISLKELKFFINTNNFIIITKPFLTINNIHLTMGDKLPLYKEEKTKYIAYLPKKNIHNKTIKTKVTINKKDAYKGYLPYTRENLYKQSFKYLNTPYVWGESSKGVDCSSFIVNIYKTFGFSFPRNTKDQKLSIPKIINLKKYSLLKKKKIITLLSPELLYTKNHVMLYLGTSKGEYYVIHASSKYHKVVISSLTEETIINLEKAIIIHK